MENPDKELADFLSGYARIGPYARAEAPDAARMLFGALAPEDAARQTLDRSIATWLDQRRREGVPAAEAPQFDRERREIMEALRIVSALSLTQSAADLRHRFPAWNSWIERLAGFDGPDVRAEYLSTLALTQRLVRPLATSIKPFGLEPLWLSVCEQSGSRYPETYLSIGLLGLRLLPDRPGMPSERPWMAGLAHWAAAQKPEVSEFSRQWWVLRALYRQSPGHWREALTDTLRQRAAERIPAEVLEFWRTDIGLDKEASQNEVAHRPRLVKIPSYRRVESILARIRNPLSTIEPEIRQIVAELERYAEATADSYLLAIRACNIGMRLIEIREGDDLQGRARLACELALKTLGWRPADVIAWALWRDALAAQNLLDAAEDVGWDAIRRFPEDIKGRTQLALLLADQPEKQTEAEHILQDTLVRFPHNAVTLTQLANLLNKQAGRQEEAEDVLRNTLVRFPDNAVALTQLANLLNKQAGRQEEAEHLVRKILARDPDDVIARTQLAHLLVKRPEGWKEAEDLLRKTIAKSNGSADNIFERNELAHLLSKQRDRLDEAESILREILVDSPSNIFARSRLAFVLAKQPKRQEEAEQLLREIVDESDTAIARTQLAYLLIARPEGVAEAKRLLKESGINVPDIFEEDDSGQTDVKISEKETGSVQLLQTIERLLDEQLAGDKSTQIGGSSETKSKPDQLRQETAARSPDDAPAGDKEALVEESLETEIRSDKLGRETVERSLGDIPVKENKTIGESSETEIKGGQSRQGTIERSANDAPVNGKGAVPAKNEVSIAKLDSTTVATTPASSAKVKAPRLPGGQTVEDAVLTAARRGGRLRRIAAELPQKAENKAWRSNATAEVERILAEDENFAYAQYLKNEITQNGMTDRSTDPGTFGIAFVDAMRRRDPELLNSLETTQPGHSQLLDVARAFLFGEIEAADRAVRWLNEEKAPIEPRPVAALRGFLSQRFGTRSGKDKYNIYIVDGAAFLDLIASNDNVGQDLIESALVPVEALLAAA